MGILYKLPHLLIIHISEEIRCMRRRAPSSFSYLPPQKVVDLSNQMDIELNRKLTLAQ
ncbi:hypothetical protein [Aneurinibacillus aneurinilyticus]|uniref:hypothetical protein n=1 Tax=Aneurinibacillus aneurinilyticus TaxID=1391 RepID=UPI0035265225